MGPQNPFPVLAPNDRWRWWGDVGKRVGDGHLQDRALPNQSSQRASVSVGVRLCGMGVWGFSRAEKGDFGNGRVLQASSPAVYKWQIPVGLVCGAQKFPQVLSQLSCSDLLSPPKDFR